MVGRAVGDGGCHRHGTEAVQLSQGPDARAWRGGDPIGDVESACAAARFRGGHHRRRSAVSSRRRGVRGAWRDRGAHRPRCWRVVSGGTSCRPVCGPDRAMPAAVGCMGTGVRGDSHLSAQQPGHDRHRGGTNRSRDLPVRATGTAEQRQPRPALLLRVLGGSCRDCGRGCVACVSSRATVDTGGPRVCRGTARDGRRRQRVPP